MRRYKIWIDLDNSPHVPFFAPIIRELRKQGHHVILTSRDNAQVKALVQLHGLEAVQVGHHFGKNRLAKIAGTLARAARLALLMRRYKPDLAVSHGSRSQIIGGFLYGVPTVSIFDYEFASSAGGIKPKWVMAPSVIPVSAHGAERDHWFSYPGIKEDVYVPDFRPDASLRSKLGIGEHNLVVTIRPPASEAHYHNRQADELLRVVVEHVCRKDGSRIILLPRTERQDAELRQEWSELIAQGRIVIPQVSDGLNLIWNSDLVVSGGGTMNREAAALSVPVYSIFRGTMGAVDKYLAADGRLVLIERNQDVEAKIKLARRQIAPPLSSGRNPALTAILAGLETILENEHGSAPRGARGERRATIPRSN